MNKNFFLTLAAVAVMTTIGYAAYTNGSITDLSSVINNRLSGVTSVGSNYLGALVTTVSPAGKPMLNISAVSGQKGVNILPAQKSVVFGSYALDARKSSEDVAVFSLAFSPSVSKGGYIDDIQNCQLFSEGNAIVSDQVGTLFGKDIVFRLRNENSDPANPSSSLGLLVLKGAKSVINLKCDVASRTNSANGATFRFAIKKANATDGAIGMFSKGIALMSFSSANGPVMTLRTVGDLAVSASSASPVGRELSCGMFNNKMLELKLSSSFEDIYVKKINLALSGTATSTAVTRFTLHDGDSSVILGEGAFGTNKNGEAFLTGQGLLVPARSSKNLSVWIDLSTDTASNRCQIGRTIGIDYIGSMAVGATTATEVLVTKQNSTKVSGKRSTLAN